MVLIFLPRIALNGLMTVIVFQNECLKIMFMNLMSSFSKGLTKYKLLNKLENENSFAVDGHVLDLVRAPG